MIVRNNSAGVNVPCVSGQAGRFQGAREVAAPSRNLCWIVLVTGPETRRGRLRPRASMGSSTGAWSSGRAGSGCSDVTPWAQLSPVSPWCCSQGRAPAGALCTAPTTHGSSSSHALAQVQVQGRERDGTRAPESLMKQHRSLLSLSRLLGSGGLCGPFPHRAWSLGSAHPQHMD